MLDGLPCGLNKLLFLYNITFFLNKTVISIVSKDCYWIVNELQILNKGFPLLWFEFGKYCGWDSWRGCHSHLTKRKPKGTQTKIGASSVIGYCMRGRRKENENLYHAHRLLILYRFWILEFSLIQRACRGIILWYTGTCSRRCCLGSVVLSWSFN